jgi:adenylylsulfate kinase
MIHPDRKGFVVWFSGLQGSGKTTLANLLQLELQQRGFRAEVLDWDVLRPHITSRLKPTKRDRKMSTRRIGFISRLLGRNGVVALAVDVASYRDALAEVRASCECGFVEVHLTCNPAELLSRHLQRANARALAGQLPWFFGWTPWQQEPIQADLVIQSDIKPPADCLAAVMQTLEERGYV